MLSSSFVVPFLLLTLLSIFSARADMHCTDPQKGFYLSYNALSKRDTMGDLFTQINSRIPMFNYTYDNGKNKKYVISSMHPQMYYNQHHQKQVFLDPQHVNVTLGDVELAFRLVYNITSPQRNASGWARGRVLVDQTAYFIKRLLIKDGYLEWDPTEASNLTVTYPISIEYSEPTLQYDEKTDIELILNDHVGDRKVKTQILASFNQNYRVLLKQHLNKQDIINTETIRYTYRNITLPFINAVKNYTLSSNQIKGLSAYFFFQAQNKTYNCTGDKIHFNQVDYGGVQQFYSISSLRQALKGALDFGLFNIKLDKKWQVPEFQFYMGDLANSVRFAENFIPDQPFQVQCGWSGNKSNVQLTQYADHQMMAVIPTVITISYKTSKVLQINVDISFVVKFIAGQDTLTVSISVANLFGPEYKALDPKFVVTNQPLARYSIGRVLNGLSGSTTFGTGFKIAKRKFPSTHISQDYLVVFDPSEI